MAEQKSRFFILLEALSVRPADFGRAIGADKTLVSRWCNGRRKFMNGHKWAGLTADYLLQLDEKLKKPVIPDVLKDYYNEKDIEERLRGTFIHWLVSAGHLPAAGAEGFEGVVRGTFPESLMATGEGQDQMVPIEELPVFRNAVLEGIQGILGAAVYFLKWMQENKISGEFIYLCAEGVELFTRNEEYSYYIQEQLEKIFAAGGKCTTILYTDFRTTDVAAFSGGWLTAHLQGNISSYYYDDFHPLGENRSCIISREGLAIETVRQGNDVRTYFYFDKEHIEQLWSRCQKYKRRSKSRFCYDVFHRPGEFFRNIQILPDRIHYQFSRMPYFGITDGVEFGRDFLLSEEELAFIAREFSPVFHDISFYDADTPVRHMFCEEDIDEYLLQERHVCQVLSVILGRRVNMKSQALVYRLARLKELMEVHANYEICFLPREIFMRHKLQLCVWSDRAVVAWLSDGGKTCHSGASKETSSSNALAGFCATVWTRIPKHLRTRRAALQKIDLWLKKARRYGYEVEKK